MLLYLRFLKAWRLVGCHNHRKFAVPVMLKRAQLVRVGVGGGGGGEGGKGGRGGA
jgi:hypothetical protein